MTVILKTANGLIHGFVEIVTISDVVFDNGHEMLIIHTTV